MADRGYQIRYEGLDELRRAFRAAGSDVAKLLHSELRGVSEFVRDMAVYEAHSRGYDDTGDLIRGLKAGVTGTTGYVRDVARHGGYNYPGRLEYQDHGSGAFIRPVVTAAEEQIADRMLKAVEQAVRNFETKGD